MSLINKGLIFFILIGFTHPLRAQDYKISLENRFLEYYQLIQDHKIEKSMDYVNDDFLKVFSKNDLVKIFKSIYENPLLEFKVERPLILGIEGLKKYPRSDYVKFSFSDHFQVRYSKFAKAYDTASVSLKKIMRAQFIKGLESKFGKGTVQYNEETQYFQVHTEKTAIGSSKDDKTWKFLILEPEKKSSLEKIIPKEFF